MQKISIIVPIYNVEKYLRKCVDSLIEQSLKDIEIILVDDGSTDESGNIADNYSQTYDNIKVFHKENGGLSDARNYGLKYATGEYIAFLDSDDYIEHNAYEELYKKAKEENSDYVECDFIWEYPNKSKIDKYKEYSNKKEMFTNVRVVAWNKLIKKSIIEKYSLEFPKGLRYEDVEFTYKLIPHLENVSHVDKPFVHYIQRTNSIANNQNSRNAEIFQVLDNVIDYYKKEDIYDEYRNEIEYTYTRISLCSSFKRICGIKDKKIKKELLEFTWTNLNQKFPEWKKNHILRADKSFKGKYMKTVNSFTYKIYSNIL